MTEFRTPTPVGTVLSAVPVVGTIGTIQSPVAAVDQQLYKQTNLYNSASLQPTTYTSTVVCATIQGLVLDAVVRLMSPATGTVQVAVQGLETQSQVVTSTVGATPWLANNQQARLAVPGPLGNSVVVNTTVAGGTVLAFYLSVQQSDSPNVTVPLGLGDLGTVATVLSPISVGNIADIGTIGTIVAPQTVAWVGTVGTIQAGVVSATILGGNIPVVGTVGTITSPANVAAYGFVDPANSSTVTLPASATMTGTFTSILGWAAVGMNVKSDVVGAVSGWRAQFSEDGINPFDAETYSFTNVGTITSQLAGQSWHVPAKAPFFRAQYVNGAGTQGYFNFETTYKALLQPGDMIDVSDTPQGGMHALVTKSQLFGINPVSGPVNLNVDTQGDLVVSATVGVGTILQAIDAGIGTIGTVQSGSIQASTDLGIYSAYQQEAGATANAQLGGPAVNTAVYNPWGYSTGAAASVSSNGFVQWAMVQETDARGYPQFFVQMYNDLASTQLGTLNFYLYRKLPTTGYLTLPGPVDAQFQFVSQWLPASGTVWATVQPNIHWPYDSMVVLVTPGARVGGGTVGIAGAAVAPAFGADIHAWNGTGAPNAWNQTDRGFVMYWQRYNAVPYKVPVDVQDIADVGQVAVIGTLATVQSPVTAVVSTVQSPLTAGGTVFVNENFYGSVIYNQATLLAGGSVQVLSAATLQGLVVDVTFGTVYPAAGSLITRIQGYQSPLGAQSSTLISTPWFAGTVPATYRLVPPGPLGIGVEVITTVVTGTVAGYTLSAWQSASPNVTLPFSQLSDVNLPPTRMMAVGVWGYSSGLGGFQALQLDTATPVNLLVNVATIQNAPRVTAIVSTVQSPIVVATVQSPIAVATVQSPIAVATVQSPVVVGGGTLVDVGTVGVIGTVATVQSPVGVVETAAVFHSATVSATILTTGGVLYGMVVENDSTSLPGTVTMFAGGGKFVEVIAPVQDIRGFTLNRGITFTGSLIASMSQANMVAQVFASS